MELALILVSWIQDSHEHDEILCEYHNTKIVGHTTLQAIYDHDQAPASLVLDIMYFLYFV